MKYYNSAVLVFAISAVGNALSFSQSEKTSPITRVVELLKGLSKKIEEESKTEEDLYNKYVCWGQNQIEMKEASNIAAKSRITVLINYMDDLTSGRIELTTEREDLTKESNELKSDLEAASNARAKEKADYDTAKAEMEKAITALKNALQVLGTATHNSGGALLERNRGGLRAGFAARAKEAESLRFAATIASNSLSKADAEFLRRLLTAEVPDVDWKKLNRQATHKMKYQARSFKIQGVLTKLLETFEANKEDAKNKEEKAQATYNKLKENRDARVKETEAALNELSKEKGASGLSQTEAGTEKDNLNTQVEADTAFITRLRGELETKKGEWKERSELRTGEIGAISKAISILASDENRDLFKRSLASQGSVFLQMSSSDQIRQALRALETAGIRGRDNRVQAVVSMMREEPEHAEHAEQHAAIASVVDAIDTLLAELTDDEATDLQRKEWCEEKRANETRNAITQSREIDESTDTITQHEEKIVELTQQIEETMKLIADDRAALKTATEMRADEQKSFDITDKDDTAAIIQVHDAKEVLEKFYADNELVFLAERQEPTTGMAPPPPPKTWDGEYKGKKGEKDGIVEILTMIGEDIEKDQKKAQQEEDDAIAAFEDLSKTLSGNIENLTDFNAALTSVLEEEKNNRIDVIKDRAGNHEGLQETLTAIRATQPGCNFITINYPLRLNNRQIERDGLLKAKALLQGGTFSKVDENREMKPGDAFVQKGFLAAVNPH